MPYAVMVWLFFYLLYYLSIKELDDFYNEWVQKYYGISLDLLNDGGISPPPISKVEDGEDGEYYPNWADPLWTILIIVLCFIIAPIKFCMQLNKVAFQNSGEYNKPFELFTTKFATAYDLENPLSRKRSMIRTINVKIQDAQENGDQELVKAL